MDIHIVCNYSAHMHILLSHRTSFTEQKFKNNIIKNFKIVTAECYTRRCGALLRVGSEPLHSSPTHDAGPPHQPREGNSAREHPELGITVLHYDRQMTQQVTKGKAQFLVGHQSPYEFLVYDLCKGPISKIVSLYQRERDP